MAFTDLVEVRELMATAAEWTAQAYILAVNQIGLEKDTGLRKRGDGVSLWPDLEYMEVGTVQAFYSVTVEFDDDMIKALPDTGYAAEIVEAPGEGLALVFEDAVISSRWGNATKYTNIALGGDGPNDRDIAFYTGLDNRVSVIGDYSWNQSTFGGATPNITRFQRVATFDAESGGLLPQINVIQENKNICLIVNNGSFGNFTGGDPDNRMFVTCFYTIIPV